MRELPTQIDNRFRLRRATANDLSRLESLHAAAWDEERDSIRLRADRAHMEDLLFRPHPTFSGDEMTVVEDTTDGKIVSSQHLSHHEWAFDGIPFRVGEIEHVSTHPDFRRRGLVRLQTEVMHEWSEESGELVTVINGIPWFYTQFGYALPIDKYNGRRLIREQALRVSKSDAAYQIRRATEDDLEIVHDAYLEGVHRNSISYVRTQHHWEYEHMGRSKQSPWSRELYVLASDDEPVGFVSLSPTRRMIDAFETRPGTPWSTATFSLAHWLTHNPTINGTGDRDEQAGWRFDWLGEYHPAFLSCPGLFGPPETLGTPLRRGAWYVRVTDLPAFVAHLCPALERRLANSNERGFSGTIHLSFYGEGGLCFELVRGRISVRPWSPTGLHDGDARFADGTFLELLFGRVDVRSLEVSHPYRVSVSPRSRPLLAALFPKKPSYILPVY